MAAAAFASTVVRGASNAFRSPMGKKIVTAASLGYTAYQGGTSIHQGYKGVQAIKAGDAPAAATHFTRSILSATNASIGFGTAMLPPAAASAGSSLGLKLSTSVVRATTGTAAVATPHLSSGDQKRAITAAAGATVGGAISGQL